MTPELTDRERQRLAAEIISSSPAMPDPNRHLNYLLCLKEQSLLERHAEIVGQPQRARSQWQPLS